MNLARAAAVTAAVTALLTLTGGVAIAAPANDTYSGATAIGSLPFADTVDTSTATTDADDAELNAQCGAPATDASVWYEVTPTTDGALMVDVTGSSYSAGVLVGTGGPGAWNLVACGAGRIAFATAAGQRYSILAIDDQLDGAGNGGTLEIAVDEVPAPPSIAVTIDPIANLNARTGSVTVHGTVTCSGDVIFAALQTRLVQQIGRFTIEGFGLADVTCDGGTHEWSVEVASPYGKFSGGKAADATIALACGEMLCSLDYQERQVLVRH